MVVVEVGVVGKGVGRDGLVVYVVVVVEGDVLYWGVEWWFVGVVMVGLELWC